MSHRHRWDPDWDFDGPGCSRCMRGRHWECHGCSCPCYMDRIDYENRGWTEEQWRVAVEKVGARVPVDTPWDERPRCSICHQPKDEARSRRGRTALRAGKDAERQIAKAYPDGIRTGHLGGPDDVIVGNLLVVQSKAGPGWFRESRWTELQKLPRDGGRVPMLVISDRPGSGHPTRRYVVLQLDDHVALMGMDGLRGDVG